VSWIGVAVSRLRGLFRRDHSDRDLDDEVRFHLEMQIEDNLKTGMDPAEARYAAMRSFGGVETMKESYRDQRTYAYIENFAQDVHYGLRTLRKTPGFAITAILLLALAIGANTAMFSVLHTVLLQPLPYESPERLAMLWTENPVQRLREARSALWDVEQWRKQSRSFTGIATFDTVATLLTTSDGVEQVPGASISPNLLPLLGVQPVLGRAFSTEDAEKEQHLVLISHRFWQARFGGAASALGATLTLNGLPHLITGVLPPGFQLAGLTASDVWLPHTTTRLARGPETWFALGRLRPDVTFEQAQAEMSALARGLSEQLPAAERNRGITVVPLGLYLLGPQSRLALWILGGAVFCVFLIAAANVTSLSLARGVSRSREMSVRLSLGASAGRILRQLLTEGVLLAAVAGAFGAWLALAGTYLIRRFGPANLPRLQEISVDLQALGWALAITLLAGMLLGLAPAFTVLSRKRGGLRPSSSSGQKGDRSVASGTAASQRLRRALVMADFALAVILLAGAGLFVRSWWYVNSTDPGFRPERVLFVGLSAPPDFDTPAKRNVLYQRILDAMQSVPGVERAGIIGDLLIGNSREQVVTVERNDGAVTDRFRFAAGEEVSPDFFGAMGTPLLRGRFFTKEDAVQPPPEVNAGAVAIINESMARRSWPGQNPLGRRLKLGSLETTNRWYTVVGVVGDMRRQGLEVEPFPQLFMPLSSIAAPRNIDLFLRTSHEDPLLVASSVREAIRRVEKNAPVYLLSPLEQQLGVYVAQRRFQTSLLTGFSLVALLMAAVGIYGLIQYSIVTRTQEIGIRMAIGAQASEIFRMILGEGLRLSLTGLLCGLLGALWLGQMGSSLLFGVSPTDPWTFLTVSVLLTAVAVAACWIPARRAMKIEPITALRQS